MNNFQEMWKELKLLLTNKAKNPTSNSRNVVKQAEELANRQAMFEVLDDMEYIENVHTRRGIKDKYSL